MEADGDKGNICRRGIYKEACKNGEIRPTDGPTIQEGQRYTPYVLTPASVTIILTHITYSGS